MLRADFLCFPPFFSHQPKSHSNEDCAQKLRGYDVHDTLTLLAPSLPFLQSLGRCFGDGNGWEGGAMGFQSARRKVEKKAKGGTSKVHRQMWKCPFFFFVKCSVSSAIGAKQHNYTICTVSCLSSEPNSMLQNHEVVLDGCESEWSVTRREGQHCCISKGWRRGQTTRLPIFSIATPWSFIRIQRGCYLERWVMGGGWWILIL
ncbi:hypothetical protein BJ875DRAFT_262198 [Amylocarpus encephaloides]|uniref:Uncharacterized protein n=1 Tax=Amylocarpus encephaloides TaxID=45428 RepID=A0A9P8CA17_9HELO|nr:hypothetical protein BJ875DRAFT_262198 [Amylocarpus encephaloides]